MPKFPYLQITFKKCLKTAILFILFLFSSCATEPPTQQQGNEDPPKFEVDKEKNSIKKTDTSTTPKPKHRRPLFDWPVWEARMSRGFMPKTTRKRKRPHKGIDLAAPRGVPVMASTDGIVIYTGKDFKGFGKMIMIETSGEHSGYATLYAHLDKIVVYDGQKVSQGEVIGALGNTGRSSGPHLHFEIRKADGIPIDPLPMLPAGKDLTNDVDDPTAPEE